MQPRTVVDIIQTRSLADVLSGEIEKQILDGTLKPGDRIAESELAREWGVSRAPIREAMRSLKRSGLVEIVNHKGVFVRRISLAEVIDLFDIRAELARLAAARATRNQTPEALAEMRRLIDEMDGVSKREDAALYLDLNLRFHDVINRLSNIHRLAEIDRTLGNELRLYRQQGLALGGGLAVSNTEHKALLDAMVQRKAGRAGKIFRDHILAGRDRFLRSLKNSPEAVRTPDALPDALPDTSMEWEDDS